MNEPYFQVGEEVIVAGKVVKDFNGDAVVIEIQPPFSGDIVNPRNPSKVMHTLEGGFSYWLTTSHTGVEGRSGWMMQSALRKKHKPSDESFSQLITNIEPIEAIT